ncbi:hypothetical protein BB560_002673 [Smittium megazygosporum]|uniref:CBS domain-containing protein n=1 Tax=Smittium megazygosporum TaxID=133381 RepID=A0A2T9ZE41_9FUNG|nr:hypothetical protein BB560_002673 [Smittium megazygosporum]
MDKFSEIKKVLSGYKLQDVINHSTVPLGKILIDVGISIEEALEFMNRQNLLSVPVYYSPEINNQSKNNSDSNSKVVDIVSVNDICSYVVNHNLTNTPSKESVLQLPIQRVVEAKKTIIGKTTSDMPLMEIISELVQDRYTFALVDIVGKGDSTSSGGDEDINSKAMVKRHDILSFLNSINHELQAALDLSVGEVMEILFAKNNYNWVVNRALKEEINDGSHDPNGISGFKLSNAFKRSYTNLNNPCHNTTLPSDPPRRFQDIIYIVPTTLAIEGYKMLLYNDIGTLPVLDPVSKGFIAELEISHFRYLSSSNSGLLGKPVLAFISGLRNTYLQRQSVAQKVFLGMSPTNSTLVSLRESSMAPSIKPPWFCNKSFTLNQIMFGMINSGYRQTFVLDKNNNIEGLLSIIDVLDLFNKL